MHVEVGPAPQLHGLAGMRVRWRPFEPEAANLFFQLISSRSERASLIVTRNKPVLRWGEVFGDDVVAINGDSYRLKGRDLGRVPAASNDDQ